MILRKHSGAHLSGNKALVLARQFLRASDGVTIIEFAIVAPVFILLVIGGLDMTQMVYANSMLRGAVEDVARSATLEGSDLTAADDKIRDIMNPVLPGVTIETDRVSYFDFADIHRAEQWADDDSDGTCNDGEAYVDENGNGQWDADVGSNGNGSASDVVLFTATATYSPVFKVPFVPGLRNDRTLTASSVRKNQPFARQDDPGSAAGTCP